MFDFGIIEENIKKKLLCLQERLSPMGITTKYGTLLADSGLKTDMFNIICCTGNEQRRDISRSVAHFREKGLPFC